MLGKHSTVEPVPPTLVIHMCMYTHSICIHMCISSYIQIIRTFALLEYGSSVVHCDSTENTGVYAVIISFLEREVIHTGKTKGSKKALVHPFCF